MQATNRVSPTFILLLLLLILPAGLRSQNRTLRAPDGAEVTINRDSYGVPHISADTETGAFFGQGFAVAAARIYQP